MEASIKIPKGWHYYRENKTGASNKSRRDDIIIGKQNRCIK